MSVTFARKSLPEHKQHLGKISGDVLKHAVALWTKAVPASKRKKLAARAKLRRLAT
jgi:hypothetical protein